MANSTGHAFLRPTSRKRPAGSRASTPRNSDQTRQQTLTQIDFVTRFTPEEHVELEYEEVMGPPKSKRRRTNAKQKPVQDIYEDAAATSTVNARLRRTSVPNSDPETERGTALLYSTTRGSGRLEVPSSLTPTKTRTTAYVKEDPSPLKDTSINLPDGRSANNRRRRPSGQQPRLEVRDSFPSENGSSEPSYKLPILRPLFSLSSSEKEGGDENEGVKAGSWREHGEVPEPRVDGVSAVQMSDPPPGAKEQTQREQISTVPSRVLEIQDSEGELSDEDENGVMGHYTDTQDHGDDEDPEDEDYEPETQLPSPKSRQKHGAEPHSDEENSTQSSYGIGAETQAIVDDLDFSSERSSGEGLPKRKASVVNRKESDVPSAVNLDSRLMDGVMGEKEERQQPQKAIRGRDPSSLIDNSTSVVDFASSPSSNEQWERAEPEIQLHPSSDSSNNATAPQLVETPARPQVPFTQSTQATASLPPTPSTRASTMAALVQHLPSSLVNANTCTATQLLPESLMESFLPMPPLTQATVKEEEDDEDDDEL